MHAVAIWGTSCWRIMAHNFMAKAFQMCRYYIYNRLLEVYEILHGFLCQYPFHVLAAGPLPHHIAFIMDGNRRFKFLGDLSLLDEPLRIAAERLVEATSSHTRMLLLFLCFLYTSTNEIARAVNESCREQWAGIQRGNPDVVNEIALADTERNMYTAGYPDTTDNLIRTPGENRLGNFLLCRTTCCYLLFLDALWPEISLGHLISCGRFWNNSASGLTLEG
ncbi:hypothetical protein ACLOJK_031611 [Asimina triloba]